MLSVVEARIFPAFYLKYVIASAAWQSQILRMRHSVFAIATSEDLLAMTVFKSS
jgi:hypothetical protein